MNREAPHVVMNWINIPVIGSEREDEVCSFRQRNMCDQGPGLRFNGFEERQSIVHSRPAHDVGHGRVETEVFL